MKFKYALFMLIVVLCITACNRQAHQQSDQLANDTTALSVFQGDSVIWSDPTDTILINKFQLMFQSDTGAAGSILGGGGGGTLEGTLEGVIGLGVSGSGTGGGGVATGTGGLGSIGTSGTGSRKGIGYGSGSGYGAGPSTQTTRTGVLEEHFKIIAESEDMEVVQQHMMEVLELCVSEESKVQIVEVIAEGDNQMIVISIREFLDTLRTEGAYIYKIRASQYTEEGKLSILTLVKR